MIEPKPVIEFLEYRKLPENERPTIGTCKEHGDFEMKPLCVAGRTIGATTVCSKCSELYKAWKSKQDEIDKKKQIEESKRMAFNNRLSSYGVTPRHFDESFDSYIVKSDEQRKSLETCKYVCQKIIDGECKNIIMVGSVGTGKTHLASAMCRKMAEQKEPYKVLIATVTEMIRRYRSSYDSNNDVTEEKVINSLTNKDLLIIDELGMSKGDEKELNILFEIINNRYEYKRSTVIISNQSIGEVKELLGQRIIDRLKEDGCRVLGMAWESHRETNKDNF